MGWLANLLMSLLTMASAVKQIGDDRRRGVETNWPKTLVTGGGAVLIALIGMACLFGAMELDEPVLGLILFGLVFVVGMGVHQQQAAVGG